MGDFDELRRWAEHVMTNQRVHLRALVETDVPIIASWWSRLDVALFNERMLVQKPRPAVEEMIRGWSQNSSGTGFGYAVEADGQLAGHVSVYGFAAPEMIGSLGVLLGPEHQDRGLGAEVLEIALRLAFLEYGARKVELKVYGYNERGIRAYENAGFTVEGRRRASVLHKGRWFDDVSMGILAGEYFTRYGHPQSP